mmetsp:Transcript_44418/g.81070  ORF Transcript_44418/g.81070 Transcript_44418/m.81070 type:complete len:414 (+) Transcript_44418:68-1309(+)
MSSSCGYARVLAVNFFLCLGGVFGDKDNIFPVLYVSNPVARHLACPVNAGTPTLCTLEGYEDSGMELEFLIRTLPARGRIYDTSMNYRAYGTEPIYSPKAIEEYMLPYAITDSLHRLVYIPPPDVFPPEGRWDIFTYQTHDAFSGNLSEVGYVSLNSPGGHVAASSFISGTDAWTISGNIHSTMPTWQAYGWGLLRRYIYAVDEAHYIDFDKARSDDRATARMGTTPGSDRAKWYFEAPRKFLLPEVATAYGGTLRFTVASTYGDFTRLNYPLDWITLECASCNSGRGLRIIRFADNNLTWDGSEQVVEVPLADGNFWMRDPLNRAQSFTDATSCEIAAVLAGLTRLRILGDFTQAGEGVAIDDISISGSTIQPRYPVECQQGCECAHDTRFQRLSCCGSSSTQYQAMTTLVQ